MLNYLLIKSEIELLNLPAGRSESRYVLNYITKAYIAPVKTILALVVEKTWKRQRVIFAFTRETERRIVRVCFHGRREIREQERSAARKYARIPDRFSARAVMAGKRPSVKRKGKLPFPSPVFRSLHAVHIAAS